MIMYMQFHVFLLLVGEETREFYDEPQHIYQGAITLKLLEDIGIAYDIIEIRIRQKQCCVIKCCVSETISSRKKCGAGNPQRSTLL